MTVVREASDKTDYLLIRVLRNPHLWIVTVITALLIITHYSDLLTGVWLLDRIAPTLGLGLTRHTLERILFMIPIAYGTAMLGIGGGISVLVLATAAMLPRVFLFSPAMREALFETGGVIFSSVLIIWLLYALQKGKQRLAELETAQHRLNSHIQKLSMLHVISGLINQSLELNRVMGTAIEKVSDTMDVEAAWLYLWDRDKDELRLSACHGISGALAGVCKLGEGNDGKAAQSRKPVVAVNTAPLSQDGLRSVLVVPLLFKGNISGTLGVGIRQAHQFPQDEIDFLNAIGDQFSMAIENARLYERERTVAEALRISEKSYRDIFENASDAIWIHDLNGTILAANSALTKLTGYELSELRGANVSVLLPEHGLARIDKELHDRVLRGESVPNYEQELVRKDGNRVIVQIGTSLTTREGEPWAFQHIARDITEAKRVQDNLRLYVQKVSEAQEAERKRIARELHDETAQALVVVSRNLDDLASGSSRLSIRDVREQVRKVLEGVRRFSQELRPSILDDLGLLPALNWLASDLTKNYGITVETQVVGNQRSFPPESELMLFRIVQEALTNVRRHSGASKACIRVEFNDHNVKVAVSDNGKGFSIPSRVGDLARIGKLGLAGMQERAQLLNGVLSIDTEPAKGTTLTLEVPL